MLESLVFRTGAYRHLPYSPALYGVLRVRPGLSLRILSTMARDNIVPFWLGNPEEITRRGYRHALASPTSEAELQQVYLIPHARMTWYFSRIARYSFALPEHIPLSVASFRFLVDRLRDEQNGGYFWVGPGGDESRNPPKALRGQAFALLALAEHHLARGDAESLHESIRLYETIQDRFSDGNASGYTEVLARDWSPFAGLVDGPFRVQVGIKTMNAHLHLLEAFSSLFRIWPNEALGRRIAELVELIVLRYRRSLPDVPGVRWDADSSDSSSNEPARPNYGYVLEAISILSEACAATDVCGEDVQSLLEDVFAVVVTKAMDALHGGFAMMGPVRQPVGRVARSAWVQGEGLLASCILWQHSRSRFHRSCFLRTLAWIASRQIDWRYGEWHPKARVWRRPSGDQAAIWKAAYHSPKAVLECIRLIENSTDAARPDV